MPKTVIETGPMHKITVGYVNGTEETYYADDFEYDHAAGGLMMRGVQWRGRPLADQGFIPSTAILALWVSVVKPS